MRLVDNLIIDMCIEKKLWIDYLIIGESYEILGKMVLMCGELLFFIIVEIEMYFFYKCKYFILVIFFLLFVLVVV